MSSLSSSIADGEALLARSWSDLLEDWPGESETILNARDVWFVGSDTAIF